MCNWRFLEIIHKGQSFMRQENVYIKIQPKWFYAKISDTTIILNKFYSWNKRWGVFSE